jgi:hypothetical protein
MMGMLQYFEERIKSFFGVAWLGMGGRGCYILLFIYSRIIVFIVYVVPESVLKA